jgi:hypothetical protein
MKSKFEFYPGLPQYKTFVNKIITYLRSLPEIYPKQIINYQGVFNYGFFESNPYKGWLKIRHIRGYNRSPDGIFIIGFKKKPIIFFDEAIEYVEKSEDNWIDNNPRCSYGSFREFNDIDEEMKFLYEVDGLTPEDHLIIDEIKKKIKSYHKVYYSMALSNFEITLKTEENKKEELEKTKAKILASVRKDGNGKLNITDGINEFSKLVKKHQSKIIEIDRNYLQQFVKIINYQKQKRKNLQSMFRSISRRKNQPERELKNQVNLLHQQMHSYELVIFHSFNLVISLIEEDMMTYYEIYEKFDKLKIFNSNHENEVSNRLSNIEEGIYDLMNSIKQTEKNIIKELRNLKYVTQKSFVELSHNFSKQLNSVNSSIKANNLLTAINAYQTYKVRKGK